METSSGSAYSLSHFSRIVDLCNHTVLLFICVQTSYYWCFLCMAEDVGFEPTRRLITDLSVFKTDPFSLLGNPPNNAQVLVLCAVSYGAFKDRNEQTFIRGMLAKTQPSLLNKVTLCAFSFHGGSHALMSRTKDSWQRILDSNQW